MARSGRKSCLVRALTTALVVLVLGLAAAGAAWWALFIRPATDVPPGQPVQLEVPSGSSTAEIATLLAAEGVVRNPNRFRLQSRLDAADGNLRAGVYDLTTGMSDDAVIARLLAGPPVEYVTLAIPEGFTVDQVVARTARVTGLDAAELKALAKTGAAKFERPYLKDVHGGSLEGYLFPKTYRVKKGTTAAGVLSMMLDQFERETAGLDLRRAKERGLDLNDVVILASMVEREAKVPKEQRLVASVIYNRLARGMRLEIDATIEYVLPGNRFRLRTRDLRVDSPYNTYLHGGLPAGPIANPGLAALKAAAKPADTTYLYYVLTGKDGSHTFARTEAEFLRAKRKSKEVFGR